MGFEWDQAKNQSNIRKHGIDFRDAVGLFENPILVRPDERKKYGEKRWIGLGKLENLIAVVVYTKRGRNFRIISVRKANKTERQVYRERIE